jgi:hypothetical protein
MEFDQGALFDGDDSFCDTFGADAPDDMPREPAPPGYVWTYRTRGCMEPGGGIMPIHSWGLDRVGDVRNAKEHVKQSIKMAYGRRPWAVGLTKDRDGRDAVGINTQVEKDVAELRRFFGSHVDGVPLIIECIGVLEPQSEPTFGAEGWWWWHTGRRLGLPYRRRRRGRRWWGWAGPSSFGQHQPSFGDDTDP